MRRKTSRWWLRFLGLVTLLGVAYFAVPDPTAKMVIWLVAAAAPVAAILVGVHRYRPARRLPWLLLAAGQTSMVVGDLIFDVYDYLLQRELPAPSLADGFYLATYPFLVAGLLLLNRARIPRRDRTGLVDALIVTVSMGVLSWVYLMAPYVRDPSLDLATRLTSLAYPLADMLLLGVVARLWGNGGRRNTSFVLLITGLGALLAVDSLYYGQFQLGEIWGDSSTIDAGWLVYYGCLGAVALHPGMRQLATPVPEVIGKITRARFGVLLALASLLAPVVLAIQAARGQQVDVPVVAAGSLVLFALALIRMSGLVGALEALHQRQSESRLQRLVRNASDVITICDTRGVIRYQTPSAARVLGWPPDELVGTRLVELVHPDDTALVAEVFAATGDERPGDPVECRMRRRDGTWIVAETVGAPVDDDGVRGVVLTTRDITERKALEDQLTHRAFHDDLTGLANRALFVDRVQHALDRRGRADMPLAVLLLDVDDFKDLNDSLGHSAGDELLTRLAERLQAVLRSADTAARLGGDEFAVLLDDLTEATEASRVAERVLAALRVPCIVYGRPVAAGVSIGIALTDPDRAQDAEELLRNADMAMYRAKRQGKNRYEHFVPSMHTGLLRKLELTGELRRAVEVGEFAVHYQPIVRLDGGNLVGVEALVRWQHPRHGLVSPADFIPLAEETGLIVPIGRSVLLQACAQAALWHRDFPALPLTVNVNLSVRQVQDPGLVAEVAEVLAITGLCPAALTLEITESVLAEDQSVATERLWALKRLGVHLAVDDFGTGYSSLSRLRHFPIDSLKIPKPFVDGILQGPEDSALARAIIELSGTLGLRVVAEGIEERDQWTELNRLGCELGQGFYFARPVPADEIGALVERDRLAGTQPLGLAS
jgi:diguanylate cyclase (GGDEF)-like protein/PAS domain S-box-containing protein